MYQREMNAAKKSVWTFTFRFYPLCKRKDTSGDFIVMHIWEAEIMCNKLLSVIRCCIDNQILILLNDETRGRYSQRTWYSDILDVCSYNFIISFSFPGTLYFHSFHIFFLCLCYLVFFLFLVPFFLPSFIHSLVFLSPFYSFLLSLCSLFFFLPFIRSFIISSVLLSFHPSIHLIWLSFFHFDLQFICYTFFILSSYLPLFVLSFQPFCLIFSLPFFLVFIIYLMFSLFPSFQTFLISYSVSSFLSATPFYVVVFLIQTSLYRVALVLLRTTLSHAFIGQPWLSLVTTHISHEPACLAKGAWKLIRKK